MEILNFVTCVLRHQPVRRVSHRECWGSILEASTWAKPLSFPEEQGGPWRRGGGAQKASCGALYQPGQEPLSVVATGTAYRPNLCPGFIFLKEAKLV